MEKAIACESLAQLESLGSQKFSRLYFGPETCQEKIPSLEEAKKALSFCEENSKGFSLVTPFCTDAGIKKLKGLLPLLSEKHELIANDFGVLSLAQRFKPEPVAGRLLNRQLRDPRITELKGHMPHALLTHLSLSQASSPNFRKLLSSLGVKRVELDNLLQGIGTSVAGTGFNCSLYFPLVFVSATRLCLAANAGKISESKRVGIFPCARECSRFKFRLQNRAFPKPLWLIGNALFFENSSLPPEEQLAEKGIDRLVLNAALRELG